MVKGVLTCRLSWSWHLGLEFGVSLHCCSVLETEYLEQPCVNETKYLGTAQTFRSTFCSTGGQECQDKVCYGSDSVHITNARDEVCLWVKLVPVCFWMFLGMIFDKGRWLLTGAAGIGAWWQTWLSAHDWGLAETPACSMNAGGQIGPTKGFQSKVCCLFT